MRDQLRFATFLAPNMFPVYQFIADYVGAQLNRPTTLRLGSSFAQFAAGTVDVGFLCGLPYVHLTREQPAPIELVAAPVLQGERYQGRPIYFSDVIVRRESPFRTFADLRGRRWAYNDPDSHSGYNLTRAHLVSLGETKGFFGRVVGAGSHQQAIRLIAAGAVDAAAIDSQVLAIELRDHPELATVLRVLTVLGPSTIQPVVAARRLPAGLKQQLGAVLLAMADDPLARSRLADGFIDRFVAVTDADYNDIRNMCAAAEEIGFLTLA